MKPWSDFYDLAAPDLPGCPLAVMDVALRLVTINFCEHSLAWTYAHPDIPVTPNIDSYAFTPPAGAVVHAIIRAEFNGRRIDFSRAEADREISGRNRTGIPGYVRASAMSLILTPTPDTSGTLAMTVALKPSPDAAGIDDSIFDEYREAIVHGALARLMLSPKKPYTNMQLAQYHEQLFAIRVA
ncbi:MAG TPA: hypothetical protein VL380_10715, partial [Nitrosospira sp.]|nr:hypothetical protein [Nitrosospira sp.]